MKRAKIGDEENQMIIMPNEQDENLYEITVYHDPSSEYLTIFVDKKELIRLVGQLEVITDLV